MVGDLQALTLAYAFPEIGRTLWLGGSFGGRTDPAGGRVAFGIGQGLPGNRGRYLWVSLGAQRRRGAAGQMQGNERRRAEAQW